MFWKLAVPVAAAVVAAILPPLSGYWFWVLLIGSAGGVAGMVATAMTVLDKTRQA